jgi:hypothetical protein
VAETSGYYKLQSFTLFSSQASDGRLEPSETGRQTVGFILEGQDAHSLYTQTDGIFLVLRMRHLPLPRKCVECLEHTTSCEESVTC